ncbi:hypothetical protein AAFF27_07255 [Xylophilus sp. GW821-FHT01B05]
MRAAHTPLPTATGWRRLAALAAGLCSLAALAQAPAADAPPPSDKRVEQRIENIRVEDGGSRIDEVRYGGQTQSITVQPKAQVPEYQITPTDGARRRPAARDGAESDTGQRVWRVMGF